MWMHVVAFVFVGLVMGADVVVCVAVVVGMGMCVDVDVRLVVDVSIILGVDVHEHECRCRCGYGSVDTELDYFSLGFCKQAEEAEAKTLIMNPADESVSLTFF